MKSKSAQKLYDENVLDVNIPIPIEIWFFVHLWNVFWLNFRKILLFYKPICTQTWGQISSSKFDHQR